jgi:hypothetical protein
MGLASVVLFQHKIASNLFEKDFDQMGAVPVVIQQSGCVAFFDRRARHIEILERRRPCVGVPVGLVSDSLHQISLSQQRPFNQRYITSIVGWQRIAMVLPPPLGSVNITLTLFWVDIRSVFDVLQK